MSHGQVRRAPPIRARRRREFSAAALEPRLLLATLSGTVYNDANANGNREVLGEAGLVGWTVYVDGNANGTFDAGELNSVSATGGAWSITSAGFRTRQTYHVRLAPQSGWRLTEPAAGDYAVAFTALTDTVAGLDFGQTRRALVTGSVFNDENDDGNFDRGEAALSGRNVFADANDNGVLDAGESSDMTDTSGDYALAPAAGTYTIRQVQQAGWWQTFPSPPAAGHAVTVANGQILTGRNFGNVVATIDLMGVGFVVTSAIDPVPADGRIDVLYQVRNDGTADSAPYRVAFYLSDDATITTSDTLLRSIAQGALPRHATVERTQPITLPTPDPLRSDNEYWVGMIVDSDNDVAETVETNNANRGPLLDRYPLAAEADLPRPVDNSTVRARPIAVGGRATGAIGDEWIGGYDQDIYRLPVTAGHRLQIAVEGLASAAMIRLYNGNWSLLKLTTGTLDYDVPATDAYYVVLSSGGNGLNDPRRLTGRVAGPTGPYTLTIGAANGTDLHSTIASWGGTPPQAPIMNFRIEGASSSSAFDVALYLSDDDQVTPADRFITTVRVTSADYNSEFGYHIVRPAFVLPAVDPFVTDNEYWVGLVLDSSNEIPERDETNNFNQGEGIDRESWRSEQNIGSPADGQTVSTYSAAGFGNPLPMSIGDEWIGPYDQDLTPVSANANETLSFDVDRTSGSIDSYVRLYDSAWTLLAANDNGAAPGEAPGLDSFLRYTFTVGGRYWVVVSGRGNDTNHPLLLTGRTPASTGDLTLTTTSEPAGDVTGIVFHDADADGVQDPGESGLAGRRVYIDSNSDEQFTDFEPSVLTDEAGSFRFTGLRPSTYTFRQVTPPGWIPTAPASQSYTLVLTSGLPAGSIAFGTIQQVTLAGTAYNDVDGDGTRDAGEGGRSGVVAYADLNNNGVRDLTSVTLSLAGVPVDIAGGRRTTFTTEGTAARQLVLADVDALLDVRDDNYDAYLYHAGLSVHLLRVPDSSFSNRLAWEIDDEAATATGLHRRPLEPLAVLDGASGGGRWWLTLDDQRQGGVFLPPAPGTLYDWSLNLTLSEPFAVTDATGAYTLAGLLPGDYHVRAEREADWIPTAPAAGVYDVTLAEGGGAAGLDFGARPRRLQVAGHHVFYNNSAFDGRNPAAGEGDDQAIDPTKSFLPAVQNVAAAHVTSYARGINGVMIDVDELLTPPTLADFSFKVPSPFNPSLWLDVPAPTGFAVRDLPGGDHRRRVTFTWPDNMLRNTWLQVGVLANAATRRLAPDLAYVANLVGESGAGARLSRVDAADLIAVRTAAFGRAAVDNPFDMNRDGWVNVRDMDLVRANLGRALPAAAPPPAAAAGTAAVPTRRSAPTRRTTFAADLLAEQAQ